MINSAKMINERHLRCKGENDMEPDVFKQAITHHDPL